MNATVLNELSWKYVKPQPSLLLMSTIKKQICKNSTTTLINKTHFPFIVTHEKSGSNKINKRIFSPML